MSEVHPQVQRVVDAAAAHKLTLDVVEFPDGTRTAVDAAAAVGCEVGQIVKSLIFDVDGHIVLALTSGANRVDTTELAALAEGSRCGRADADGVRKVTGFAIGGVPPFGHAHPVPAFLDPQLLTYDIVWAAAGTPRHVFPIEPAMLETIAGAVVGNFAESG